MGCLEKIVGSLLGLFFVVAGVWGLVEGSYNGAQCCCFTISGGLFALLNWMTNYEDFESLWESFFSVSDYINTREMGSIGYNKLWYRIFNIWSNFRMGFLIMLRMDY